MVPPGLRGAVCWTSREGGLYLHKLHTAWLRQRRIKKSLKDPQFYFSATHFSAHLNSVLPCGFSRLPSSLSLVNMVLSLFFPDLQKTLTVLFFCFVFFFPFWVAGLSASQLILFETFHVLMQVYKMATFQEPIAQGFFNQKKKKSILHFQNIIFTLIWTMWNLCFSCRVKYYLSKQ